MFKHTLKFITTCVLSVALFSCADQTQQDENAANSGMDSVRIVSLNGTISETLAALGLEGNIVGVDVTSTYPESLHAKTKVGHTHNLNVEAILSLNPDYVISVEERGIKPEQATQLEQAGVKVWVIRQEYTVDGTKQLIHMLADSFKRKNDGDQLIANLDNALNSLPKYETKPSVVFIYARGAGTLSVGGNDAPMAKMIELAGGTNAASEFEGFKPLTAESMVQLNPDMILLFDSGLQSLEGPEGMLKVPGVAQTTAGKNKNFVVMEGQLLSGFGPRLAEGIKELGQKIHNVQ